MGTELGADLYELWDAGHRHLPAAADRLDSAEDVLDDTGSWGLMSRPDGLGTGSQGPFPAYADLRVQLRRSLSSTALAVRSTGEALVFAADTYAATDAEAAAELHRLQLVRDGIEAGS